VSKQEGRRRAQALSELGRIYCDAQVPPELQQTHEQQMEQALKKLQDLYCGTAAAEEEEEEAAAAAAAASSGGGDSGRSGHGQSSGGAASSAGGSRQQGHYS